MMIDSLINKLSKANLLSSDDQRILKELNIKDYQQVIYLLSVNDNKQVTKSICRLIAHASFVMPLFDLQMTIPALTKLLKSPDWEIRQYAIEAIGQLKAYDQLGSIGTIITSDNNLYVRMMAINVLAKWNMPESAMFLTPIVNDKNQPVTLREIAIEALGDSHAEEALSSLILLLKDDDPSIRFVSVLALHNLRNPKAIVFLEGLLDDDNKSRIGIPINLQVRETIDYLRTLK